MRLHVILFRSGFRRPFIKYGNMAMNQQNLGNTTKNNSIDDFVDKLFASLVAYENYEQLFDVENDMVKYYTSNTKIELERYVYEIFTTGTVP